VEAKLAETAEKMRGWVEAGKFRAVANYPEEMNTLFDLMKLPRKTRWLTLRGSETAGLPIVKLVSQDDTNEPIT
jgi:hypothetical protein